MCVRVEEMRDELFAGLAVAFLLFSSADEQKFSWVSPDFLHLDE